MKKTLTAALVLALALGMMAGPSLANQGEGQDHAPVDPDDRFRNNSFASQSDPVELSPGDVEEFTAEDDDGEEVTFWAVRHGVTYENSVYREPARLGPDNFELGGSETGSFWFGIAGPDLTEIVHEGTAWVYFDESGDGDWTHLKAEFADDGELLQVNGVEPQ